MVLVNQQYIKTVRNNWSKILYSSEHALTNREYH